jgi:hypothetical protein
LTPDRFGYLSTGMMTGWRWLALEVHVDMASTLAWSSTLTAPWT